VLNAESWQAALQTSFAMLTHFSIKAALWALVTALLQHIVASDPVDWAALTVPEDPPLQYTGDVRPSTLHMNLPLHNEIRLAYACCLTAHCDVNMLKAACSYHTKGLCRALLSSSWCLQKQI
jgi:hypothetical protein